MDFFEQGHGLNDPPIRIFPLYQGYVMKFSNGKGILTFHSNFPTLPRVVGGLFHSFSSLTFFEFKWGFMEHVCLAQRLWCLFSWIKVDLMGLGPSQTSR